MRHLAKSGSFQEIGENNDSLQSFSAGLLNSSDPEGESSRWGFLGYLFGKSTKSPDVVSSERDNSKSEESWSCASSGTVFTHSQSETDVEDAQTESERDRDEDAVDQNGSDTEDADSEDLQMKTAQEGR